MHISSATGWQAGIRSHAGTITLDGQGDQGCKSTSWANQLCRPPPSLSRRRFDISSGHDGQAETFHRDTRVALHLYVGQPASHCRRWRRDAQPWPTSCEVWTGTAAGPPIPTGRDPECIAGG